MAARTSSSTSSSQPSSWMTVSGLKPSRPASNAPPWTQLWRVAALTVSNAAWLDGGVYEVGVPMEPVDRPAILHEGMPTQLPDIDPDETSDWISSLNEMIET